MALASLGDHPARAYHVQTTIFLSDTRNTSVKLSKGEHLFVLTDRGIEEAPHVGPDDVMIVAEHFGCWPVVAIRVPEAHVGKWRTMPADVHVSMMKRVRRQLPTPSPDARS
jgi:hypothetical protein